MTTVLVTDGDERAALAVVRSLGRAGHTVHVCGSGRQSLAGVSRQAARTFAAPDPLRAPAKFVEAVAAYAVTNGIGVVLPITEAALLSILADRTRFADAVIPFPSIETFRAASDKRSLGILAARLGIAIPFQRQVAQPTDLGCMDLSTLPFPVVVKPARSVGEHNGVRSKHIVQYALDAAQLRAHVADLAPSAFPLLLQQRVIGTGCGVFLLRWGGSAVASFAHRRIREKPPAGGVSVYAEAVPLDPELLSQSERLLSALNWQGVAMVEYKRDATTGIAYLMEINGRFWGSLQLAIDAGVDFPVLLLRCALGETVRSPSYRAGTRGRWWWGEVDHVLARLRRTNAELALPSGSPTRTAVLVEFLSRWRRNEHDAVFQLNDLAPFLYESVRWARRR